MGRELSEAIDRDDAPAISKILDSGADPLSVDEAGRSPLMRAAFGARSRAVAALLPRSHARARNFRGQTALEMAIAGALAAASEGRAQAARDAIRALAPASRPSSWSQRGESTLRLAAKSPCAALAFEELAPFCAPRDWARLDRFDESLLDAAVMANNAGAVRWLLDSGLFDANAPRVGGARPNRSRFDKGSLMGVLLVSRARLLEPSEELVALLAERADFDREFPPGSGWTVFSAAMASAQNTSDPRAWRLLDAVASATLDRPQTQALLAPENPMRARLPKASAAFEARALREAAREGQAAAAQREGRPIAGSQAANQEKSAAGAPRRL